MKRKSVGVEVTSAASKVYTEARFPCFPGKRRNPSHECLCLLLSSGSWKEAHELREALLEYITTSSGAGTLLDGRRYRNYDARANVDAFLNQDNVKVLPSFLLLQTSAPTVALLTLRQTLWNMRAFALSEHQV